jgi:hypothetical protein
MNIHLLSVQVSVQLAGLPYPRILRNMDELQYKLQLELK